MPTGLFDLGASSTFVHVWFWFMLLIGFVWARRHFDLNRGRREHVLSPTDATGDAGSLPPLSVLVAAKDEEANIGTCIDGLRSQDYPSLQIVVVNDRSHDQTGRIIDAAAARDARILALHVAELPVGWFGKNNAMRTGVAAASTPWLCFTDADCRYDSPKLLAAAMRFALDQQVGLLSVLPRLEAATFWETVVQPVAGAIMVFWNPPQKVNSPRSKCAYANGAFMLMSREAYAAIGGHDAVKATLNEDMHMARRAKQVGVRLRVIRGGDMYRVRMYTGLRQIWRGWSRIFYGCFGTLPRLFLSLIVLAIFSLSPYITLACSLLAGSAAGHVAAAAALAIISQQSLLWRFYPISGVAAPWALSYPLGVVLCLGMIVNALCKAIGMTGTTWRGTAYQGGS